MSPQKSEEDMFRKHQGLVHHVLRSFGFAYLAHIDPMIDYDDLVQLSNIALVKAIREYDSNSDTTFSTFAVKVIKNKLLKLIYNMNLQKNKRPNLKSINASRSFEDESFTYEETLGDFDDAFSTIEKKDLWEVLSSRLSQKERDIFVSYTNGDTFLKIGERYDLSGETIRQIYKVIVEHLRKRKESIVILETDILSA